MKQTPTFHRSTIASTASRIDVDAFDKSVEAFDDRQYLQSLHTLLDYINPELRAKYGNPEGNRFEIPHGSIVVNLAIEGGELKIEAPFLTVPEKGRIPLLRQIASLNINVLDLTVITLRDGKLFFEYRCPIELVQPHKIYFILDEICQTGDRYDDEFATKFGAGRIYEPRITPYDAATVDKVYDVIQLSCRECLSAVKDFENERKYGYAWNIIATTLLKVLYFAHPQGQLLNVLNKAVEEHDREDIPLPEVVVRGKEMILKLQQMTKEQLAEDLYFVETFVPGKRRSNLSNIQQNFQSTYEKVSAANDAGDYMAVSLMILYKFYEMYHFNNVQDDINALVTKAMEASSAKPWDEAAPILYAAMDKIMDGELEDDEDDEDDSPVDLEALGAQVAAAQAQAMQGMQQAMQGIDMAQLAQMQAQAMQGFDMEEYMKNMQRMMAAAMGNAPAEDEDK